MNFWADYNGTDSDGDGIGDSPYFYYDILQDNHPLMKPVVIPATPEPTTPTSPTPFPTNYTGVGSTETEIIIGAAIVVAVIVIGLGLLVYLIKRK